MACAKPVIKARISRFLIPAFELIPDPSNQGLSIFHNCPSCWHGNLRCSQWNSAESLMTSCYLSSNGCVRYDLNMRHCKGLALLAAHGHHKRMWTSNARSVGTTQSYGQAKANSVDNQWTSLVTRDWKLEEQPEALVPSTEVLGQQPPERQQKPRWTDEETQLFQQNVVNRLLATAAKRRRKIDWDEVSESIVARKPSAIYSRYRQAMYRQDIAPNRKGEKLKKSGTRWTLEEDDALRTAVALYGPRKWKLISEFVETRGSIQCYTRWGYLNDPLSGKQAPPSYWAHIAHNNNIKKSEVNSPVLEAILSQHRSDIQQLANSGGSGDDDTNGVFVDLKKKESVDERLPKVERSLLVPFTVEEDKLIISLVRLHGRKWSHITKLLNSAFHSKGIDAIRSQRRTANWIRARYEQLVNPIAGGNGGGSISQPTDSGSSRQQKEASMRWTEAEDKELTRIVEGCLNSDAGFSSWSVVADRISTGRSATQCAVRWTQAIGTHLKQTPFTKTEDEAVWPFVLDEHRRRLRADNKRKLTDAEERLVNDPRAPAISVSWLSAKLKSTRSTFMLEGRIQRLLHVAEWLQEAAGVQDPHLQFGLVRRLANAPSDFRIFRTKKSSVPQTDAL